MDATQGPWVHRGKGALALAVTVVIGPILLWSALICVITIVQQILSGLFDLSQTSWTQVFNPAVWFGLESIGGTGGILDALIGGPGAPGGTVSRYFTFLVFGLLVAGCYAGITSMWAWARQHSD
jgi:hypothetical protein